MKAIACSWSGTAISAGWYLPGGGVEVGETFDTALKRELIEEGCIELSGEPVLHGVFLQQPCFAARPCRGLRCEAFPAGPDPQTQS